MFLGRVVGEVWATKKASDLVGKRLLVVEALDERREPGAPKVTPERTPEVTSRRSARGSRCAWAAW